jgi:hypothetical protein
LRDPLRPFVLRANDPRDFSLHVFDGSAERIVGAWKPESWTIREVEIDLAPKPLKEKRLEVAFVSPTDLRSDSPDFGTVFVRARDRVSTLRAAYGGGPLEIDFKGLGEIAAGIAMVRCELRDEVISRRSASNGRIHPIGGFTGTAIYEGEFEPFLPILQAAQFTGIGRKTVWGNGAFRIRLI